MFVSLNVKSILDNEPSGDFVGLYFNISNLGAVVEAWNNEYARLITLDGNKDFLITRDDWQLLKKQIEAEQRKQSR